MDHFHLQKEFYIGELFHHSIFLDPKNEVQENNMTEEIENLNNS